MKAGSGDKTVAIIASENGALPGAKVGGIADVIKGLAEALASRGWHVIVVTPAYSSLHELPGFAKGADITTHFRGEAHTAQRYCWKDKTGVEHILIEHPLITGPESGRIYYDDPPDKPFATDANRFALFSALVASWLAQQDDIRLVHLNDWHTAPILVLRRFDPMFAALRDKHFVFTIHNLAIQGIRPLRGDSSSLFEWFPALAVDNSIVDPRWNDCVNLMRSAINLADGVNTVSPGYALEITQPDDPETGRHGGEGLEADLQRCGVVGILNGCDYPAKVPGQRRSLAALLDEARREIMLFAARDRQVRSAHLVALERIASIARSKRPVLVTSVGRVSTQKLGLLLAHIDGRPVLHHLLDAMPEGLFVMLGSGDENLERQLAETSAKFDNFVFLAGFSAALANDLYRSGRLFLMPSSFEPCGISQMLAMRAGQPCLVHAVGGLRDTISNGVNGYSFDGDTLEAQCRALLASFRAAYKASAGRESSWRQVSAAASAARYTWEKAAIAYESLYARVADET